MYVVLDVILNHSGDVFAYKDHSVYYTGRAHNVEGFWPADRTKSHNILPLSRVDERRYPDAYPDGAIWPVELQDASNFSRKGMIRDWDALPESVEGDFFGLKSFNLGPSDINNFVPSPALDALCKIYQYWIAYADIDGFRIDTVRHMGDGPTRYFNSKIRNFTRSLGKNNFLLVGEISNHRAREIVLATELDAALSIGPLQRALNLVPRGQAPASDYFDAFSNGPSDPERWARNQIVNMIDDHDQIWKISSKARFCADHDGARLIQAALGLNLCTIGIPCVYYGTEQNFNGSSNAIVHSDEHYADQFIREAMFGGAYGAFYSRNHHCFDESSPTYRFIRDITLLRANEVALRRGDQFLCAVAPASLFHRYGALTNAAAYRRSQAVVAWLRSYEQDVLLCAINTSCDGPARGWVTLHEEHLNTTKPDVMQCLYPIEDSQSLKVAWNKDRSAKVLLSIPPAGFVVYKVISGSRDWETASRGSFAKERM
jgi:glycosidase